MTKKFWSAVMGIGMLTLTVGCAGAPTAPTSASVVSSEVSGTSPGATSETTTTSAVVTLQPDETANPSTVTVPEWTKVQFVNNSGQYASIQSYNCTEFSLLEIPAGYSRRTEYFRPAGKKCDYFAWADDNYSRRMFVGSVIVQ